MFFVFTVIRFLMTLLKPLSLVKQYWYMMREDQTSFIPKNHIIKKEKEYTNMKKDNRWDIKLMFLFLTVLVLLLFHCFHHVH